MKHKREQIASCKRRSLKKELLFFYVSIPTQPRELVPRVFFLTNVKNTLYIGFMGFYSWVQGGFRGKVGAHIGQKQNGKYIQKAYAVPKNPQSEKQQAQRNKFNAPNEYNKYVLAWNFFPDQTGSERANANAKQISDFFKYNESLKSSLYRMRFPEYQARVLPFQLYNLSWGNGEIDIYPYYECAVDEDDEPLEAEAVIRVCVFNYTKQFFLFLESPKLTPEEGEFYGDFGFLYDFEIQDSRFNENDVCCIYYYAIIDGVAYDREFANADVW